MLVPEASMCMLEKLPAKVKTRVAALKNLQVQSIEIKAQFYAKVRKLEVQLEADLESVNEQRRKIVMGEYEPTAKEANRPLIHNFTKKESKALKEKSEPDNGEKGIPEFWLNVLKSADVVGQAVQEHDEPVLKHLTDVTCTHQIEPPGFTIFFHFDKNSYFKNTVLKKQYKLKMKPDAEEPFAYERPVAIETIGDKIDWKKNKDVTKQTANSFFNLFDPPKADKDRDDHDEALSSANIEIGEMLRDHVIPRAVLFFTGEQAPEDTTD